MDKKRYTMEITIDLKEFTVNVDTIPDMHEYHVCIRNADSVTVQKILEGKHIPAKKGETTSWVKFFNLQPNPENGFHEGHFFADVIALDKNGSQIGEGISKPFHLTEGAIQLIKNNYTAHHSSKNPAPPNTPPVIAPAVASNATSGKAIPHRKPAKPNWWNVGLKLINLSSIIMIISLLIIAGFLINNFFMSGDEMTATNKVSDFIPSLASTANKETEIVYTVAPIPAIKKTMIEKNDLFVEPNTAQDGMVKATINTLNDSQFGDNALVEVNNRIKIIDNRQTIVHPNGWPIDWKPTLPIVVASTLQEGVYTFILPPRGVQCIQVPKGWCIGPAMEDMVHIDVKYGNDDMCFDFHIGAPGQEVNGNQMRFRSKAVESEDIIVLIRIRRC